MSMTNMKILSEFSEVVKGRKFIKYNCECSCGNTKIVSKDNYPRTFSCGCARIESQKQYIGQTVNKLTITSLSNNRGPSRELMVNCYCECDISKNIELPLTRITNELVKSCGCLQQEIASRYRDLTNEKFGQLTVISEMIDSGKTEKQWICKCECGKIINSIRGASLISGHTKSCGCLRLEMITTHVLGSGEKTASLLKEKDIPHHNATEIFKKFGEGAFNDYIENYGKGISSLEQFFQREFQIEFLNRKVLNNAKYRPDFKINDHVFINTDGLYRHREEQKGIKYHFDMTKDYESEGKRILQFYEDEVYNKTDIVKSIINNVKGTTINKISARKCEIKEVSPKEAKIFFNENHLMGNLKSARCIGLYCQNTLVSALSYKIHSKKSKIEIARFGSLINTNVQGGFGKLLSAIEFLAKKLEITQIESFCDLRYATGKSYEKLGFMNKGDTLGWCWSDGKQRFNRLKCKAYEKDGLHISESEHAMELGYYKIYDAGQRKYTKILA